MRLRALKWLMMGLASCGSIVFALATSPEALACFGRCCGGGCGWGAGYRAYRPLYGCRSCGAGCSSGCATGCAPCGSGCAPCGGLACNSGDCGVAPPAEPLTPIAQPPNSKWDRSKRTYADPDTTAPDAPGAAARTETDKTIEQNTRKPEQGDSALGDKKAVQKRKRPGEDDATADESSSGDNKDSAKRRKKGPDIADPEDDANARRAAPVPVSIDEKIAWRPAPIRKRGEIHNGVASARLVRVPAYPKSEWLPGAETNIAKK